MYNVCVCAYNIQISIRKQGVLASLAGMDGDKQQRSMAKWHTMHTQGHLKQIEGHALGNEVKHHNIFIVTHPHIKIEIICFYSGTEKTLLK